jgi:hypothetical protein
MKSTDKVIELLRMIKEDGAPTVNVGSGNIAGTREAGDDPPVDLRKYKKKLSMFYRKDIMDKRKREKRK